MKKFILFVLCAAILAPAGIIPASAAVTSEEIGATDRLLDASDYQGCLKALERLLPNAAPGHEKAEVLWRLARIQLVLGQLETTKEGKRAVFGKGTAYAAEAIREESGNPECYLWHCGNIGRECQTKGLKEQVKCVPVMLDDLSTILDRLGCTNHSAAWQALAEIYFNHPFKSNDAAANFTRKALMCIPEGELRISTYALLAKILIKRDLSQKSRAAEIEKNGKLFRENHKSAFDKYACFDGELGTGYKHPWCTKPIGQMSDREEAEALVEYAKRLYANAKVHTDTDKADYKDLTTNLKL